MAKICAHGTVIGTVEYMTHAKRYMSDGAILKHSGFGWKLAGKVKAGFAPQAAYQRSAEHLEAQLAEKSAAACYRKELHSLAGLGKRWKLHAAVELMPDDPDGVWSEACDGYGDNAHAHADVDEVVLLCALYRNMVGARG